MTMLGALLRMFRKGSGGWDLAQRMGKRNQSRRAAPFYQRVVLRPLKQMLWRRVLNRHPV